LECGRFLLWRGFGLVVGVVGVVVASLWWYVALDDAAGGVVSYGPCWVLDWWPFGCCGSDGGYGEEV